MYREALKERYLSVVSPDEVPGFLSVEKIKVPKKKKAIRLTQIHGSMEGSKVLELREKVEKEQKDKGENNLKKKMCKSAQKNSFIRCKDSCVCEHKSCQASGIKQCTVCSDVFKTYCSKKKCQINGIKPRMVLCAFDRVKRGKEKSRKVSEKRKAKYVESDG